MQRLRKVLYFMLITIKNKGFVAKCIKSLEKMRENFYQRISQFKKSLSNISKIAFFLYKNLNQKWNFKNFKSKNIMKQKFCTRKQLKHKIKI